MFYLLNYSILKDPKSSRFRPSTSIYFLLVTLFSLVILIIDLGISILIDPINKDFKGLTISLGIRISIYKVLFINNSLS